MQQHGNRTDWIFSDIVSTLYHKTKHIYHQSNTSFKDYKI